MTDDKNLDGLPLTGRCDALNVSLPDDGININERKIHSSSDTRPGSSPAMVVSDILYVHCNTSTRLSREMDREIAVLGHTRGGHTEDQGEALASAPRKREPRRGTCVARTRDGNRRMPGWGTLAHSRLVLAACRARFAPIIS